MVCPYYLKVEYNCIFCKVLGGFIYFKLCLFRKFLKKVQKNTIIVSVDGERVGKLMKRVCMLVVLFVVLFTGCSNNEVNSSEVAKNNTKAQFINNGYNIEVHIPEESSDIVFAVNSDGELDIDLSVDQSYDFERLLITDGEHYIRIKACDSGKFTLKGERLDIFKAIVKGNKDVTLKGRVSSYNYFTQNIASEDIKVVGLIIERIDKKVII